MEEQQVFVISPDGEELILTDTEGGILVEQGAYSITIPQQTQQQVVYTQPQQTVYTTPHQVQQRVVYSPQQQQQVYQIGPPHSQQVVYAGGPPIKQQTQHTQQLLLQQQQPMVPQQQVTQPQQIASQQVVQQQQVSSQVPPQQVITQQKAVPQQQITQQQQLAQVTQQQQMAPQQQLVQQQQLMQQQHHHHPQQQQPQQRQPQTQPQFITPQGQRIINRQQNTQELVRQQQQVHQKTYQLQLQQQQQPQQQVQHLPLQQQQLVQQGSPQLQQQLVLQQHQLVQQPQLQQQPQQIIQAGQQPAPQQITYIQHRIEDEKGITHIVRTPVNVGNIRTRSPAQVGGQPGSAVTQSTALLPPNTSHVLTGPAIRSTTPQGIKTVAASRPQQPRLQRGNPIQRQGTLGIQQPLPQQQQQQQPQQKQQQQQQQQQQQHQQDEQQQPSYQDQYLKQLQNKIDTQQKSANRSKVNKPPTAQQRMLISHQLSNQQHRKQQVGAHVNQAVMSDTSSPSGPTTAKQHGNHQQQVQQVTLQAVSPTKKLSLHQYRQRISHDLKHHQQQQQSIPKLVTTSQGTVTGEEVRIPVSVNKSQKQQYYYVERSDGSKMLAVFPMDQGAATTVALNHPISNMTSSTSVRSTHFAASASESNAVITMKHQDDPAQTSSEATTLPSQSLTLSSSRSISSNNVSSTNSSSTSPPLQEHIVHSSVPTEQTEKSSGDKPRFIAGQVRLCTNCGILSEDLLQCQRCKHKLPSIPLPEPPTTTAGSKTTTCDSMTMTSKGISVAHMTKQEFYGKTGGGNRKPEKKIVNPANNKTKAKGRGKGKIPEEPVILTLSSDEEEDKPGGGSGPLSGSCASGSPQPGGHPGTHAEPVNHKEPIITADMEDLEEPEKEGNSGVVIGGGIPDIQSLNDGTLKGPYTSLQCRSLRIGSYKVMPKERVLIVPQGLRIEVPPIAEDSAESVTFDIPVKSVVKILVHFGRSLPVFFMYIKPSTAANIRRLLKMTDRNGYYFDPCSHDESQKRITILPDKLTEENKNLVKEVFGPTNMLNNCGAATSTSSGSEHVNIIEELDHKEANEILLRASSAKAQNLVKKPATTTATFESKLLLIYPPPPQKGGISISTDDYCCLEEEQFLNDVILDFYLKWLLQSKLSEIHRQHTHVFSTFFYKRLTSKPKKRRLNAPEDDPKLSAAEKRHARVRSWTKNVDIFSKDFIIIPINEHAHWFLAIICFPGLSGPVRISDGQPVPVPTPDKPKKRRSTRPRNRIEIPIIDDGDWSDRDEAEGEEDELEDEEEEDEESQTNKKGKGEEAGNEGEMTVSKPDSSPASSIKQPCILIFDSLTGANRARIVATLRDYLTVEHKVRKGTEKLFTRDTMKGACPRVPQQMNYSDCGVYTLQFAESFFEDPIKDYTFPIRSLSEWFPQEVVRGKREAVAKLIAKLMEEHNPNHSSITLPDIYFSSDKKEKGGTNMAHVPSTSEPQDSCSTSNTPLSKLVNASAQNTVPGQDISKTTNNLANDNNCGSSKEQNSKLISFPPNSIIEGKLKDGEIRVYHNKEGNALKPVLGKAVQNRSLSVKSIPLCIAKSDQSFSVCAGQINLKKFQKTSASSVERTITVQKLETSTPVETHVQVNSMKRQCLMESEESIFPVRVEKKRVPIKDTNLAQTHGSLMATETVISASNNSGLSLIKAVYNGDSNDSLQIDTKNEGINLNGNKSCLKEAPTDFCGVKNLLNSDVNGIHTHVHESSIKDKVKSPENITNMNGDETVSKSVGNEVVQVVSPSQSSHSSVLPKFSYLQKTSVPGVSSAKLLSASPTNVSVQQNIHNSNVFSSASTAKSVAQASCNTSTQSRKIVNPTKMPSCVTTFNIGETQSMNQLKTVEPSRQKIIIDDEVLLIMNPSPGRGEHKMESEVLPAKQQNIIIHEEKDFMNTGETTEMIPSKTVGTQPLSKSVATLRASSPVRRVGMECAPTTLAVPSGSSSPSQSGPGTPAVFRFSERGTSSGRTIAPPKRYLDDDEDIFPKKRRDKPAQGKARNVVR